ncbi:ubiquitin conjugating enzyme, partial [Tothia fuscella]
QATKRIMSEWRNLMESPPPWTIAAPAGDDLGRWRGFILGPPHTPYSGGAFEIEVVFPPDYPIKPMSARFITRIFHPNVTEMGIVIIGPLTKEAWSPVQTISHILMHITSIMIEPVEPFDCEELSSERETLFVLDRRAFDEKAKDWTEKYAV